VHPWAIDLAKPSAFVHVLVAEPILFIVLEKDHAAKDIAPASAFDFMADRSIEVAAVGGLRATVAHDRRILARAFKSGSLWRGEPIGFCAFVAKREFCVALKLNTSSVIFNTTDGGEPFMADLSEHESPTTEAEELQRVADLLGGARILRRKLSNPLDAHEMLLQGLPGKALSHLIDNFVVLQRTGSFEKAVGMSLRTFQRRKDTPAKPLSQEQSGRTWKFAEILAKATAVLGSQGEAEQWLERPAIGLDQRRPIDLLATPAGVEMVEDFLERLEYGVYV
jgi:putative toxin-antitoxin system antitoxin component (TIGR02293 family)